MHQCETCKRTVSDLYARECREPRCDARRKETRKQVEEDDRIDAASKPADPKPEPRPDTITRSGWKPIPPDLAKDGRKP